MSEFVAAQRINAVRARIDDLITPLERPYRPNERAAANIGLDPFV
jgi:hypothetical protein